jgi:hypothetical protein
MPPALRRLYPYALLALLALPALWPLAGPGLPRTNDALPHYFRAVELDTLVRAGVLFPRWAPDLVHGYGYPVFNYFPYMAHGLIVALHGLGLGFLAAYKAACGLALLASAWWAYRLGREHFGHLAGLVAGTAYLYSPYLLYDTYIRGSLPESLALALLPLMLLYLHRAALGQRRALAYAAVALAAAVLSHQGVMLQALPFVVFYGGVEVWTYGRGRFLASIRPHLTAYTLALLLSAFFTLPALFEARYVQIVRGTANGGMSYLDNFLSLAELFALPPWRADPALLNPPVVRPLPIGALALAVLALLRLAYQRFARGAARPQPAQARAMLFFALAAVLGTSLILPVARPLWDTLPLLRLTLFPWRLLGPVSLFLSLLAGSLFSASDTPEGGPRSALSVFIGRPSSVVLRPSSFILHPSSFILLLFLGLPFAAPPREPAPSAPTLADVAAFEIPPDFIGTTTVGEYLPIWVRALPDTAPNRDQLRAGQPVQRHEAPGAAVEALASRPGLDRYRVEASQPVTFLYRTFYFPGWQATLDGQPIPITITDPDGLISVAIPAGTHTLTLHFGTTPIRAVANTFSLLGLLATAAVLVTARAPQPEAAQPHLDGASESPLTAWPAAPVVDLTPPAPLPSKGRGVPITSVRPSSIVHRPSSSSFFLHPSSFILLVALAFPLLRLLYDASLTPGPRLAERLDLDFAGELTLLGARASTTALAADDVLRVDLYWQAQHPLGIPYGFDVRLVDAAGHTWSQPEVMRPRDWRFTPGTDFWPIDQYILEPYLLQPVAGSPPGDYAVRVNVFAWPTLQTIGTQTVLPVAITTPSRARACPAEAGPEAAWDGVALASYGFSTQSAAPGDDLTFGPCWQVQGTSAERAPQAPLAAEISLLDGQGQRVLTRAFTPGAPYPASRWQPGDALRDQVDLRLPAAAATGAYTWSLSVNGSAPLSVGELRVTAPQRAFAPPAVAETLDATLGPVTLVGLDVPRAGAARGAQLPVTLVWRANALLPDSYHVFVHLLGPDGALAAQSDGVPAGWTRRTTGWLPGEYVTDARALSLQPDLAPGTYTLWAGLYLPATGERLVTHEFPDGRLPLGDVLVD